MADYILGICTNPACDGGTLYRSSRPLEPTDRLEANLFVPTREDIPPPPPSGTADCPLCSRKVVFTYEKNMTASKRISDTGPAPMASQLETLFSTEDGEIIINMVAASEGWTVIWTNKRIVRFKA